MTPSARFWCWHLVPAFILWLFLLGYAHTDWDVRLMDALFDPTLHSFSQRHSWWLEVALHDGLRSAVITLAVLLIVALFLAPSLAKLMDSVPYCGVVEKLLQTFISWRRELTWALLGMALTVLVIAYLKRHSVHACPWDLERYGGHAPFIPILARAPTDVALGRCFPAAHATGGFCWLAMYFAWRERAPRFAYGMLAFALLLGNIMGLSQCLRGAHFLSHQLWSLLWVWLVLLGWYTLWPPQQRTIERPR